MTTVSPDNSDTPNRREAATTELPEPLVSSSTNASQIALRAVRFALFVSLILVALKALAWVYSGSVALFAGMVDSLMDSFATVTNWMALTWSQRPRDHNFRFGKGKAEALGAIAQAAFITASAIWLWVESTESLLAPEPLEHIDWAAIVAFVSLIGTGAIVFVEKRATKSSDSLAVRADLLHYISDFVVGIGILVSLAVYVLVGWRGIDSLMGFAVGLWLFYSGWQVAKEALDMLLDRELPIEDRANILELAVGVTGIHGVHEIRTRRSGRDRFIQLHIELDGNMSLRDAHAISETVEKKLANAFQGADIIVHQDPYP